VPDPFTFGDAPLVVTAIHAGHDVRPAIGARLAIDEQTRLREEDPFTDRLTDVGGARVVVHRSRFEVDLNRPRETAVYRTPEEAWGLVVWREELPASEVEQSLEVYDAFYAAMAQRLDVMARRGAFVVLDLHSYNHRREGADAPPSPAQENPEVNIGTGSLDRGRWGTLVDRFARALQAVDVGGHRLDVRENVRFQGGALSTWVNERYDGRGAALALEFKKVFMDEWTGALDAGHLSELRRALGSSIPSLLEDVA
jgi:N-formylglutamate amidohydrolase